MSKRHHWELGIGVSCYHDYNYKECWQHCCYCYLCSSSYSSFRRFRTESALNNRLRSRSNLSRYWGKISLRIGSLVRSRDQDLGARQRRSSLNENIGTILGYNSTSWWKRAAQGANRFTICSNIRAVTSGEQLITTSSRGEGLNHWLPPAASAWL